MIAPREEDITLEVAQLGVEAEAFEHSPVGRYLIDRAETEIEIFKEQLVGIDPADVVNATKVRNKILVNRKFLDWLRDAIAEGRLADAELRERESYM